MSHITSSNSHPQVETPITSGGASIAAIAPTGHFENTPVSVAPSSSNPPGASSRFAALNTDTPLTEHSMTPVPPTQRGETGNPVDPFRDVPDPRDWSEQDEFESILLEMRCGKGIVAYDGSSVRIKTDHLDGLSMIKAIAEGRIEFPLHHLELSDYSLRELLGALAAALGPNMEAIDEQIATFAAGAENPQNLNFHQEITFLENYKQSIERARVILLSIQDQRGKEEESIEVAINSVRSITEKREEEEESIERAINRLQSITEQREDNSVFPIINKLRACFSLHSQSLEANIKEESIEEALNILQEIKDQRREGNYRLAGISDQEIESIGKAINILQEVQEQRKVDSAFSMINKLHACFSLHSQSLKALAAGNLQQAQYLNIQAIADTMAIMEETSVNPRLDLIANYNKSVDLARQALVALAAGNNRRASYLYHQADALRLATEETSRPNPRQDLIDKYEESYQLACQAEVALNAAFYELCSHGGLTNVNRGNNRRAEVLINQADALRLATEETSRPNPRQHLIDTYEESYQLARQAQAALAANRPQRAWCLNNQADALRLATEEASRPNPRPDLIDRYEESYQLARQAQAALAANRAYRADFLIHQAIVLRLSTEEASRPNPRQHLIDAYEESYQLARQAQPALNGDVDRYLSLMEQAIARRLSTEEASRSNPRPHIIAGYEESYARQGQALATRDEPDRCLPDALFTENDRNRRFLVLMIEAMDLRLATEAASSYNLNQATAAVVLFLFRFRS